MVEAGPVLSSPVGMNVRNIPDEQERVAARLASQAPQSDVSGLAGIPTGTVVEGTITARQGTHLVGNPAPGSGGMPAAAVAACVGGEGAHWTCATPQPAEGERVGFSEPGAAAERAAQRAADRGAVENVFSRYMHYHNGAHIAGVLRIRNDGSARRTRSSARACPARHARSSSSSGRPSTVKSPRNAGWVVRRRMSRASRRTTGRRIAAATSASVYERRLISRASPSTPVALRPASRPT
jgi:hypothetical protein